MPKMPKRPSDPTSTEVIHGSKVNVGKEVGKKVAKKAKSSIQLRKEMRDKFLAET